MAQDAVLKYMYIDAYIFRASESCLDTAVESQGAVFVGPNCFEFFILCSNFTRSKLTSAASEKRFAVFVFSALIASLSALLLTPRRNRGVQFSLSLHKKTEVVALRLGKRRRDKCNFSSIYSQNFVGIAGKSRYLPEVSELSFSTFSEKNRKRVF